mmetsp:Transcript_69793/g.116285  ORF Transcript_69793/g.116285 Transcript_69793/m.116285 type:complete len:115 (+) Transcript_69793:720-1064(+)
MTVLDENRKLIRCIPQPANQHVLLCERTKTFTISHCRSTATSPPQNASGLQGNKNSFLWTLGPEWHVGSGPCANTISAGCGLEEQSHRYKTNAAPGQEKCKNDTCQWQPWPSKT